MAEAKPLRFSVDSLTVGDLEDIEELTGMGFDEIMELLTSGKVGQNGRIGIPLKVLKALVLVVYRADNPNFTMEDARRVKVSELDVVLAEPDPTEPAAGGPSSSSATSGTSALPKPAS